MTEYLTSETPILLGRRGAGVRIAVVDSGVAAGHPHIGTIRGGTSLVGDETSDVADRLGHGTAVAAAIREKAPEAELIPVRVLDRQLATSARILARAIHWAVDAGAHLVNLSLGTINEAHIPLFEEALAEAASRQVLVVSASSHDATRWYPGSLPGTVGVVAAPRAPRHGVAVVPDTLGMVLEASPWARPIDGVPVERNLSGVSFAVANATGIIALALEAGAPRDPQGMLSWIADHAVPPSEKTR